MSCGCGCALTLGFNGVVSVNNAETLLLAANANRKNAIIENLGSSVVQVYLTSGQAFGAGPFQLAQYQTLELAQVVGVYKGAIYAIRAAATENVGVVEET